jgi:hypothetical protein
LFGVGKEWFLLGELPTQKQEGVAMAEKKPVHKIRLGRISAAIWRNKSDRGGQWYRVGITRSWKHDDEWRETTSYDLEDLPVVSQAAQMAHAWIWEQKCSHILEDGAEVL